MPRRAPTFSRRWLWRLVLVPLPFLMALPFLLKPSFSLVDDGVTLDVARRMDTNEMSVDKASGKPQSPSWYIERDVGRVRPAYWWWLWFNYKLYGTRSGAWHFGLALSIAVLLQLFWEISYRTTGSVLAGVLAGGLVVAFHPYAAVFTRLGIGETPLLLVLGVSVLCVVRGYSLGPRVPRRKEPLLVVCFVGAVVTLVVAYFVKETCLVMLPTSVVMLLALWRRKADVLSKAFLIGYVAANVVAAVALLAYVVPVLSTGSYAKLYFYQATDWALAKKLETAFVYFLGNLATVVRGWSALPVLALAAMGVRLVRAWRGKGLDDGQRWQLVWLTFAVGTVVVLAPWGGSNIAVPRYLFSFAVFAALLIGGELAWLASSTRRLLAEYSRTPDKYALQRTMLQSVLVFIIAFLVLLGLVNATLATGTTLKSHRRESADANLVRLLAAEAPEGEPLFVKLVVPFEEETRYEIRLHLNTIYKRADFRNDHTVQYLGDPQQAGIPERYRSYVGVPRRGQWIIVPRGRYRRELDYELAALDQLLRPTRAFVVSAKGWEEVADPKRYRDKLKNVTYGWVVFESGEVALQPPAAGGGT
jgi:hypothetical protein